MSFEYINDLRKWNFLHHANIISIAAEFIDMHTGIDLLYYIMEMLPILVVLHSEP